MPTNGMGSMSTRPPSANERGKPDCKCCQGTGIRDIWVIDGWSFTDCLCKYGWTVDASGRWQEPKSK